MPGRVWLTRLKAREGCAGWCCGRDQCSGNRTVRVCAQHAVRCGRGGVRWRRWCGAAPGTELRMHCDGCRLSPIGDQAPGRPRLYRPRRPSPGRARRSGPQVVWHCAGRAAPQSAAAAGGRGAPGGPIEPKKGHSPRPGAAAARGRGLVRLAGISRACNSALESAKKRGASGVPGQMRASPSAIGAARHGNWAGRRFSRGSSGEPGAAAATRATRRKLLRLKKGTAGAATLIGLQRAPLRFVLDLTKEPRGGTLNGNRAARGAGLRAGTFREAARGGPRERPPPGAPPPPPSGGGRGRGAGACCAGGRRGVAPAGGPCTAAGPSGGSRGGSCCAPVGARGVGGLDRPPPLSRSNFSLRIAC